MKLRITSLMLIISLLLASIPVLAADKNDSELKTDLKQTEIVEEPVPTLIPPNDVYYTVDETCEEILTEPEQEVLTEIITDDIKFSEEEYNLKSESFPNPESISTFAELREVDNTFSTMWNEILSVQFSDDYLKPYEKKEDGQCLTGHTNRLIMEETDLKLEGKNGLDLVLRRKHDNQDYNEVYTPFIQDVNLVTNVHTYLCSFKNIQTNNNILIAFYTEADFYEYMGDGAYLKSLDALSLSTYKYNNVTYSFYEFADIKSKITEDTECDYYQYNDNVKPVSFYRDFKEDENNTRYKLSDRALLTKRNEIYNDWKFIFPEIYMYRYSLMTEKYNEGTSNEYKSYDSEYIGAFRALDGNVYMLEASDEFKRYKDTSKGTKYTSRVACPENKYLSLRKLYETERLHGDGPQYNFTVKDVRGLTYYLYNPDAKSTENPPIRQRLAIVAIEDEYGNNICFEYDSDFYKVEKIIDTYGREINIARTDNTTTVSYYDDAAAEIKTIQYEASVLPASALNNDSALNKKEVQRLTVTNQNGEKTIYDSRKTNTIALHSNELKDITDYPDKSKRDTCTSCASNIERIIYPTGAETRYKYKYIFPKQNDVVQGVYALEQSYDILDNQTVNRKQYSLSGRDKEITITEIDEDASRSSVSKYDIDGYLSEVRSKSTSGTGISSYNSYLYEHGRPTRITVSDGVNSKITSYTYQEYYPDALLEEVSNGKKIIYTYHMVDMKNTGKVKTATYQYYKNRRYITDYIISTELTADGKEIEYERLTKDGVIKSQTKYEYDSEGNVSAVKQWTADTNEDGTLDENDDFVTTTSAYSATAAKNKSVINSVPNISNADGTNEGDISVTYTMNMYGSPVYQKDANGTEATIEYDALNRPVKYILPNGSTQTAEYVIDAAHKESYTIFTDSAGVKYKNVYDGIGRIKAKYRANGANWDRLEKYTYDAAGRLYQKESGQQGASAVMEEYTYDALDHVASKKVYENNIKLLYTENYKYASHKVTKTTVAADGTQKADEITYYDTYGNVNKTELKSGTDSIASEYEYDYQNRKTKETDPNGNSTTYEYDCKGNMIKATNAKGNSVSTQYDLAGRAVSVTDANGNTAVTDYDNLGRVVSVTAPFDTQNAITKTYYDKNSNIIKKSVRKSADIYNSHEYKYDEMGNLLASISGEGEEQSVVQYTYDSASRITKMITGLSSYSTNPTGGSVTQYTYDKKGFLETITDPMGNDEEYWEYDKYGNLMQMSDRNVSVNTYTYGAYGLTQKSGMTGLHNTTVYNSIGQPVKTTARNEYGEMIEESYTYDPFGRLTSKTANDGTVQNYTYDNNSNVVTYTMTKNGETKNSITYKYNSLNQLTQFDSGDMMYQYVYDNNGNLKRAYDAKLVNINYEITYNKSNLPQRIETDFDSKSYDYTLSYWLNGQKYLERDTINNIYNEYAYNSNGQLEFEHEMAGNKTISESEYTYDASGNRTQKRSWNPDAGKWDEITDYTYDANNRLTNEIKKKKDEIISAMRYYYDKNGNMTAEQSKVYTTEGTESSNMGLSGRIGGGSAKVYTYDRFNRLIQYNDGAKEATYTYGADNLRASKTVNGTKTEFVWNGQNLASETTDDVTTIYNYDMTGVLGSKRDGEAEVRYHKDPHGNVLAMEKNYALLGEYTYDAFGNQLTGAEADTPFRYCGEYFDNESGNIYLRNRYYSTATGRFITEDPIKDGVNWYSYCSNNPVMLIDPLGLSNVPKDLDWDGDGRIDTREDRNRFDTNKNRIADWNENGISKQWYQLRNSNVLSDFPYVYQEDTELCWAACTSMVVEWFAKIKMDFIQIAKDKYGENYNRGTGGTVSIGMHINEMGYLEDSGYEVDKYVFNYGDMYADKHNRDNNPLTFQTVRNLIDSKIPIIMEVEEGHVEVVIGYAYDDELGKQMVICNNSNSNTNKQEVFEFDKIKRYSAITFRKCQ